MAMLRVHLRAWSAAWLLCQLFSITALLPATCCAAHRHAEPALPSCHDQASAQYCPHHAGSHHGTQREAPCTMRGTCDVPTAVLASLLSVPGVLVAGAHGSSEPVSRFEHEFTPVTPVAAFVSDTPPPRS